MHKSSSCVKIKGAKTIHLKFRTSRKLIVLMCFIIIYAQILSCFENRDVQDLTLSIFIIFQLQSLILLILGMKLLLRSFQAKRVIIETAMMKIFNNCISGRLNNYFPLNEVPASTNNVLFIQ